ncbi:XRE family transcriptional regulator [Pseudomonas donghuensis]|nr:XRE family transcriptional regulator [Pseudomonas donghuensis]
MALREAFAAVLQLLREHRLLSQHDIAGVVTQSHVSQLEASKTSATLETSQELAKALKIHPVAFLALVHGADEQKTARDVLEQALRELDEAALLDARLPTQPTKRPHPRTENARKVHREVQILKAEGKTQAETITLLGLPRSTVNRHWNKM